MGSVNKSCNQIVEVFLNSSFSLVLLMDQVHCSHKIFSVVVLNSLIYCIALSDSFLRAVCLVRRSEGSSYRWISKYCLEEKKLNCFN